MNAPIFISYRTSDGRDKATALARDLGARFGDAQVFLDKDDLPGGSRWRDEVARALGARPILLLLLTPQLFSATDAAGALRIADPNDPVRRELGAALQAGAHIVPLCCDGVDAPPTGAALPPPFDRLGDFTWRRLRAYDWKNDLARLEADLLALGVAPSAEPARVHMTRRVALLGLALAGVSAGAVLGWRAWRTPGVPAGPTQAAGAGAGAGAVGLPGTWLAWVERDPPFALTLLQQDSQLALTSEPMPIDQREGWAGYRAHWLRLTGVELRSVIYRGRGTVVAQPGLPLTLDIAWQLFNGGGDTRIDSGNLHLQASPDGSSLEGRLWSNGDQADRAVVLRRP